MFGGLLILIGLAAGFTAEHLRRRGALRRQVFLAGGAGLVALVWFLLLLRSDLELQKFAGACVMPAGLLWLAFFFVALFDLLRAGPRAGVKGAILWCGYSLIGNVWVGAWMIRGLEAQFPEVSVGSSPVFDAVLVLGGGSKSSPEGEPEVSDAGDRLVLAARLFYAQKTGVLVASGTAIEGPFHPSDLTLETLGVWTGLGIPATAIRRLPSPKNTSQEVAAYAELIQKEGWTRVGVISSAYHLPRIMRLAKRAGLDLTPLPADHRGIGPPFSILWLVPQSAGFANTYRASWEWIGMLVGR